MSDPVRPPPTKENPPDPDSESLVGAESRPAGIEALPSKLVRYAKARRRAVEMETYLRNAAGDGDSTPVVQDEAKKCADRLHCCGEWLHFRHYFTVDQLRLVAGQFCQLTKLCPLCAIRRGARNLKAYLERYYLILAENPGLKAYMVTLTVKNGPNLDERMNHLRKAMKRAVDRRRQALSGNGWGRTEFRKMAGAVGSYEVTNKGNGWHPHIHLVALFSEEPDRKALIEEWRASTGDSYIIDVRPLEAGDPVNAFCEVFKYAMKFQDMSLADNWRAHLQLRGKRLLISFGCFYGIPEPELTDEPLDGLPYVDMFFRYLAGEGVYSHDRSREVTYLGPRPAPEGAQLVTVAGGGSAVAEEPATATEAATSRRTRLRA